MSLVDNTLTIAEKELGLDLRYKLPFLLGSTVNPLIRIIPFLLVYAGFFTLESKASLGEFMTFENFISFLFLGIVADSFFNVGYTTFRGKFLNEKYWQTTEILLLAPINRLAMITGVGLAEIVSIIPTLLIFLGTAYFFYPISLMQLFIVLAVLLMLFVLCLSLGLIAGSASLFNENLSPIFDYARVIIVFFSCFYYPREILAIKQLGALGELFPSLALLNPIYQANFIIRSIWFTSQPPLEPLLYLTFFAIVSPIAAVYIFVKLWKWMGIQGY